MKISKDEQVSAPAMLLAGQLRAAGGRGPFSPVAEVTHEHLAASLLRFNNALR
jgi:hypothetical protein